MSVVGLELEEEIGHMADEQIANAKIFFTLSLSRMFYCFVFDDHFCFQHFISVSLMTNRAGLKLLQNLNKSPPVLIGQGVPKTLGFH